MIGLFGRFCCSCCCGIITATGVWATSSLIVGTQLDAGNWDGMGMQVFFISSINGDQIPEIISTAHCTDSNGPQCGSISCYDGWEDPGSGSHALIWRVDGEHAQDQLGETAANVGDLDGDGLDDVIVAARLDDTVGENAGVVRLLSGVDGREIGRVYPDAGEGAFGSGLATPGDLDGDAVADFVVGTQFPDCGSIAIFSGADGQRLSRYVGPSHSGIGPALACMPDVDNDDCSDILVGSERWNSWSGIVWLISGGPASRGESPPARLLLHSWSSPAPGAHFGATVSVVGDIDGDQVDEIAIGAPGIDAMFIYSGASGLLLHQFSGSGTDGVGKTPAAAAGDLNGDGIGDILIAAPDYDVGVLQRVGIVHLISGYDWSVIREIQAFVDGGDACGAALGVGGDLDGNGVADVLVGIPGYGDYDAGTAYGAVLIERF